MPAGNVPSSIPLNVLTGKLSPSWAFIGLKIFVMKLGSSFAGAASSTASFHVVGTSILVAASKP